MHRLLTTCLLILAFASPASAQTWTWNGAVPGNSNWDAISFPLSNWNPNLVPPDTANVVFNQVPINGLLAISLNGPRTVNSFTIASELGWSFSGGTLHLTSGNLTRTDASPLQPDLTFSTPIFQGGNGTWSINGANGVTVTGALSGSGSLTKTGAGTLSLESNNTTYNGALAVNGGTVRLRNVPSISLASLAGTAAGTFDFAATNVTVGSDNTSTTFAGTLTGTTGTFNKVGTGTLTLTPATGSQLHSLSNSDGGHIIFDGGSVVVNSLNTSDGGNITLQNGATVSRSELGLGTAAAFGSGQIHLTGAGTSLTNFLRLGTFTGTTSLIIENGAAVSGPTDIIIGFISGSNSTGTIRSGATTSSTNITAGVLPGVIGTVTISDPGTSVTTANLGVGGLNSVEQGGTGHMVISNGAVALAYNDTRFWTQGSTLTIDRATLTTGRLVAHNDTVPVVAITNPVGGTALTVGSGNLTGTFAGSIRDGDFGPGGVSKIGDSVTTLSGLNTYTGVGTVSGGLLILQGTNRGSYHVTAGDLQLDGVVHQLGFGFLQVGGTSAIIRYRNGAQVIGGFLNGPGIHVVEVLGATFSGTTAFAGVNMHVNATTVFTNFTNEGNINVNASLTWNNGTNRGAGKLTVNETVNATGFSNSGEITISSTGVLNNTTTALVSSGGGRITINSGGHFNVTGGATLDLFGSRLTNNGTISGTTNVGFGALAKGTGTFGTVNVFDGGIFSPGNSPGVADLSQMTWGEAGTYLWELQDAAGAAGLGYDTLNIAGELLISSGTTTNSIFTIAVVTLSSSDAPGTASNFDPYRSYGWVLATAAGGVVGFDLDRIRLDLSGFANEVDGTFALTLEGNQLFLRYAAIPEPGVFLLTACMGAACLAFRQRRSRTRRQMRLHRCGKADQCRESCRV